MPPACFPRSSCAHPATHPHCPPLASHLPVQPDRTEQLCILALPSDMGFSELCTFMGAYFQHVRA